MAPQKGNEDRFRKKSFVFAHKDRWAPLEGRRHFQDVGTGRVPVHSDREVGDRELAGGIVVPEEVEDIDGTVEGALVEGRPHGRDGRSEGVEVLDQRSLIGSYRNGTEVELVRGVSPRLDAGELAAKRRASVTYGHRTRIGRHFR